MSRELRHDILLSEEAYWQARGKMHLDAAKIPAVTVRGKLEPGTIYAL